MEGLHGADGEVEVYCAGGDGGGGDPGAYAAVLKRKLELYCAAVAKSMEAQSQESSLDYLNSQASDTSQLVSQASFNGYGLNLATNSNGIHDTDVQGKPANSGTSKEQSDVDGDLEENMNPANAKRTRRMLSNRESARRSRKRKQVHLTDLESQVSEFRSENASLLKRLSDMTHKYKEAASKSRNLQVDVDTMKRKVNIAEEAVRRLTGTSLMFLPTAPGMPESSMPFSSGVSDAASDAAPPEENINHYLHAPPLQDDQSRPRVSNAATPESLGEIASRSASVRRVASLENLQKMIRGDCGLPEAASTFSNLQVPASDK